LKTGFQGENLKKKSRKLSRFKLKFECARGARAKIKALAMKICTYAIEIMNFTKNQYKSWKNY